MIFVDVKCPKCGRTIGNGGSGNMFRCVCGYAGDGGLDRSDVELLQEFYRRAVERDREARGSTTEIL